MLRENLSTAGAGRTGRPSPLAVGRITTAAATLLLVAASPPAQAQGSVRAWGMGGANTASARGLEAVEYNPANLAFSPGTTIGLLGAAAEVGNNTISLARYNEITGATLSLSDKQQLLEDIPPDGLRLDADLRASALGFHRGPFALSFQAQAGGRGNLDRDVVDLLLFGNELGESVDFSDTHGDGYALGSLTVSFGAPLVTTPLGRLSAGVNLRLLRGFFEMHVEEAHGVVTTAFDGISGQADLSTVTAEGGSGYGVDFGLALQTQGGWTLGLAVDNISSLMTWDDNAERHEYSVVGESITVNGEDFDAAFTEVHSTTSLVSYSTTLPSTLRLGASNRIGAMLLAADWVQGFERRGSATTTPRLNAGLEWAASGIVQPRFGLSLGGTVGVAVAGGCGLRVGFWRLDIAATSRGGLMPGSPTRGVGVAVGSSLEF